MRTLYLKLTGQEEQDQPLIQQAAVIIRRGGLVAFPTETVYGLGANALDAAAVRRIFEAKERPTWDPLIVHVNSVKMLEDLVKEFPPVCKKLARRFMPGALTFVLSKAEQVPDEVTAGLPTVAVRMPAHPVALALIEASEVPIAAPSANRFGRPSPTTAEHVLHDLGGRIDAVLDAGPTPIGVESTVLDMTTDPPTILRPGGIPKEVLESVLGEVRLLEPSAVSDQPSATSPPPSPGMGLRHYAPTADLVPVEGDLQALAAALQEHLSKGERVGVMLPTDWQSQLTPILIFDWGEWGDWETLAQRFFLGIRWLDEQGVDVILCPLPPAEGLALAVRDRLLKAAR